MQRLLLFLCLLVTVPAVFAAEAPLSLETQIRKADRILRARVIHTMSRAGSNEFGDRLIYTDVSLHIEEALKGNRSDFILTVEGGTVNGITMEASDTPQFHEGEEVILFVKSRPLLSVPFGGLRSKYTIGRDGYLLGKGISYREWKKEVLEVLMKRDVSK